MDIRAQQAREHHRAAIVARVDIRRHLCQRDRLVRELRRSDPEAWSYPRLAKAVGCSPELIAVIVRKSVA